MESLINNKVKKYLENNKLINDLQYGFRSSRSTGDLLTCLSSVINTSLHNIGEACVVELDIAKAFDRVWHSALI